MVTQKLILLVGVILIMTTLAESSFFDVEDGEHRCPSCTTNGFNTKRWLMQHSETHSSIKWQDWRGSDCDAETVYVVTCRGSCVTVTIEKQLSVNEYLYAGQMQDCADNLFDSSPDLPNNIQLKLFHIDNSYVTKRQGHRITYKFARDSFIDRHYEKVRENNSPSSDSNKKSTTSRPLISKATPDSFIWLVVNVLAFLVVICLTVLVCRVYLIQRIISQRMRNDHLELQKCNNARTIIEIQPNESAETDVVAEENGEESEEIIVEIIPNQENAAEEVVEEENNNHLESSL